MECNACTLDQNCNKQEFRMNKIIMLLKKKSSAWSKLLKQRSSRNINDNILIKDCQGHVNNINITPYYHRNQRCYGFFSHLLLDIDNIIIYVFIYSVCLCKQYTIYWTGPTNIGFQFYTSKTNKDVVWQVRYVTWNYTSMGILNFLFF